MDVTDKYDIGLVGLGVMGRNFVLNIADNGYSVMGLDMEVGKAEQLLAEAVGSHVGATTDTAQFVAALAQPRKIILLIPAGNPIDDAIAAFTPLLSANDMLIDAGNSLFTDTERRMQTLAARGIHFMGMGVSGGAEGARRGPSIMPGGDKAQFESVEHLLSAVAAKVDGQPCMAYMGTGGAGHFVKMVHNGIEYGMMQLISEAYHLLKSVMKLDNPAMHGIFEQWNNGKLNSYLVEITSTILAQKDHLANGYLVDAILDKASQKGTGKWTSQVALELGMPVPTIDVAVAMRNLSALKGLRTNLASQKGQQQSNKPQINVENVEDALYFAMLCTYLQGFALMQAADVTYQFGLNLASIARTWRGGCIVRAAMLHDLESAFTKLAHGQHPLESKPIIDLLNNTRQAAAKAIHAATTGQVPAPALSASLAYFDALTTSSLPTNMVQAQRDFFGQHTYERTDRDGTYTGGW